jgi:hypothetical protein
MSTWGRKEYQGWPSRQPVHAWGALLAAVAFLALLMAVQVVREWSFVEKFYLPIYAKTAVRSLHDPKSRARYRLIDVVNAKKQERLAIAGEVESERQPDGKLIPVLTDEAKNKGFVHLAWDDEMFNDKPHIVRRGLDVLQRFSVACVALDGPLVLVQHSDGLD